MAVVGVLVLLVAMAAAMPFEKYVEQYNKSYAADSMEWFRRAAIYGKNLAEIEAHNADPTQSYQKGVNQFTDMTPEERSKYLGYRPVAKLFGDVQFPTPIFHTRIEDLPASVDWRTHGVVTPVKNQGGCGSCWAFATTETLESHAALSVNPPKQIILAPQQLVSCCPNPHKCGGTGGCGGATPEVGYPYLASAGGQTTEAYYPYTGRDDPCKYNKQTTPPAVMTTGYIKIAENNYTAVLNALATIGPIAITVEADTWFSYRSGVLPPSGCNLQNTLLDHNVQLVGYGTDAGKDYWIVRNSWGGTWGEEGYIRLARGSDGQPCAPDKDPSQGSACEPFPSEVTVCGTCGILYDTCYPVGVKIL